jgi:biotin/methionine sulfoxide reductase
VVQGKLRVAAPSVREGYLKHGPGKTSSDRGADRFVEVSWDRALDLVATELQRVRQTHGHESIYGGSYGWASAGRLHHSPSLLKRFLGQSGGYVDKIGNHSFGAALSIMPYVVGSNDVTGMATDWRSITANTKLFVCFGGIHPKNGQIESGGTGAHCSTRWMRAAREAGVRFINISPQRGDIEAEIGAEWISIRPNTDTALMLALTHTLIASGRADLEFTARYCTGFDRLRDYLEGRADGVVKDAAWASPICDIDAGTIRALAERLVEQRTMLAMSWSVQRADHGEQPCWALTALAAAVGQIGLPGGGFGFGYGAVNGIGAPRLEGIPRPRISLGPNPVKRHVPVSRAIDMLLNPGKTIQFNGKPLTFPDIRLVYSSGGNPFHHNPDIGRVVQAWRRPETIIVHEPWWTPAARHADIVLPATTTMERNDILASELDSHWVAMKQVIAPVARSRNDLDIFGELAERLGFGATYSEGRNEMQWLRAMYEVAVREAAPLGVALPDFDQFWDQGMFRFPDPDRPFVWLGDYRTDPQAHALPTPSGRIEIWSKTIEEFGYEDCPPHPTWIEPFEWLGSSMAARFPLHMLSNQPTGRLHSQLDHSPVSRATKINGREPLRINPEDARARGIGSGDSVRVFNDRGAFLASAVLDANLRAGVVQVPTGAWYDPLQPGRADSLDKHGNPNVVTRDQGTSQLAQCPTAQTTLVEVERYGEALPPITVFDPPAVATLAD